MNDLQRYVRLQFVVFLMACRTGILPWQTIQDSRPAQSIACISDALCPAGTTCQEGFCQTIAPSITTEAPLPVDRPTEPPIVDCLTPNACGNCLPAPYCQAESFTNDQKSFPAPLPNDGVVIDSNGSIQLSRSTANYAEFAWVANSTEGTISRIDTKSGTEIGRYITVKRSGTNQRLASWQSGCNAPSRTAIDGMGNAYVSNRNLPNNNCQAQFPRMGSVTKIAFYDTFLCQAAQNPTLQGCLCKDGNNDGIIQTSRDIDGDGQIWLEGCVGACNVTCNLDQDCQNQGLAQYCHNNRCSTRPKEFFAEQDECLAWTTSFFQSSASSTTALMRGLAIDNQGRIWAGDHENRRMYAIDANSGDLLDIDGTGPMNANNGIAVSVQAYGAVADSQGGVWINNLDSTLQYFSSKTGRVGKLLQVPNQDSYGITIDGNGWLWTPGRGKQPKMLRYKPVDENNGQWEIAPSTVPDTFNYGTLRTQAVWFGRGVTTAGNGVIWAVFHESDPWNGKVWLIGYDQQTGDVVRRERMDQGAYASLCRVIIGVGVGYGGVLYMVSQQDNMVCTFDPLTGARDAIAVGKGPYTYSDFTGNIYRNLVRKQGTYTMVLHGCGNNPDYQVSAWHQIISNSQIPKGTSVLVRYRVANQISVLTTLPWSSPMTVQSGQNQKLNLPPSLKGQMIQLEWSLEASPQGESPVLEGVEVAKSCMFVGGG